MSYEAWGTGHGKPWFCGLLGTHLWSDEGAVLWDWTLCLPVQCWPQVVSGWIELLDTEVWRIGELTWKNHTWCQKTGITEMNSTYLWGINGGTYKTQTEPLIITLILWKGRLFLNLLVSSQTPKAGLRLLWETADRIWLLGFPRRPLAGGGEGGLFHIH